MQTVTVALFSLGFAIASLAAGVSLDDAPWLALAVVVLEANSLWSFAKKLIGKGGKKLIFDIRVLLRLLKLALKVTLVMTITVAGFRKLESRVSAVFLSLYYSTNFLIYLWTLKRAKANQLTVLDLYLLVYRLWRVVLCCQFSMLIFRLQESNPELSLGITLLPLYFFAGFGLLSLGAFATLRAIQTRSNLMEKAKIKPVRLTMEKTQSSLDASIGDTTLNALSAYPDRLKNQKGIPGDQSGHFDGLFLYTYWSLVLLGPPVLISASPSTSSQQGWTAVAVCILAVSLSVGSQLWQGRSM